jgi:multimeric flavodoxin WrbA
MNTSQGIVGIVGSYHKNGVIDSVVTEVLEEAVKQGVQTQKIYLQDQQIEFCTNCRVCLQEPGSERGKCILDDDMDRILQDIESADALVIGAPVNFGNINALTRRFLERCVCYGYWPWNAAAPKLRNPKPKKKAVLVSSSAAPALMARFLTGALGALKDLAKMLGAKPIGVIWVGLVNQKDTPISDRIKQQAKRLAEKLAI